jgi:hypothetical protein
MVLVDGAAEGGGPSSQVDPLRIGLPHRPRLRPARRRLRWHS